MLFRCSGQDDTVRLEVELELAVLDDILRDLGFDHALLHVVYLPFKLCIMLRTAEYLCPFRERDELLFVLKVFEIRSAGLAFLDDVQTSHSVLVVFIAIGEITEIAECLELTRFPLILVNSGRKTDVREDVGDGIGQGDFCSGFFKYN